jgi:hypothetical protein
MSSGGTEHEYATVVLVDASQQESLLPAARRSRRPRVRTRRLQIGPRQLETRVIGEGKQVESPLPRCLLDRELVAESHKR